MVVLIMKKHLITFVAALWTITGVALASEEGNAMHAGFVDVSAAVPGVIVEARYAGHDNFVGTPVTGYNAEKVVVSKEVAAALAAVQAELSKKGMALKLFDGYRPQRAVDHFVRWISDVADTRMKDKYYPDIDKSDLVPLGYIAEKSGHSRGGSVDLTIVVRSDDGTWQEMDMGSHWDLFDERSHGASKSVGPEAQKNRRILTDLMVKNGFRPYSEEWWHFTLDPEPYPDTYFDFPIK